jgi:hypothetical protein
VDPGEAWSGRRRAKHRAPRRNRANARAKSRPAEAGTNGGRATSYLVRGSAANSRAFENSLADGARRHHAETGRHI